MLFIKAGIKGFEIMLRSWEKLPDFMRIPEVRPYWEVLNKKRFQLFLKRAFDIILSSILIVILSIPMIIIAIWIKIDSKGPIFYCQERVTTYGKHFRIHKFRTMVSNADKIGSTVTVENDSRITKVGARLRTLRFDEIPQLLDVITGNMSFVGTRPEAVKYVEQYKPEYFATLLLPAGITSETSIRFKDEDRLLNEEKYEDIDKFYMDKILIQKMQYNLLYLRNYTFIGEIFIMFKTAFAIFRKNQI